MKGHMVCIAVGCHGCKVVRGDELAVGFGMRLDFVLDVFVVGICYGRGHMMRFELIGLLVG